MKFGNSWVLMSINKSVISVLTMNFKIRREMRRIFDSPNFRIWTLGLVFFTSCKACKIKVHFVKRWKSTFGKMLTISLYHYQEFSMLPLKKYNRRFFFQSLSSDTLLEELLKNYKLFRIFSSRLPLQNGGLLELTFIKTVGRHKRIRSKILLIYALPEDCTTII